jgi:hypothetical protein
MKHFLSRALILLYWLVPVGLVAGLWHLNRHGLDRAWRERVAAEFERKGIGLSFERLTLNPFRGLVVRDVDLRLRNDPGSPSARVSRIILDIDYANLARRKPFLDGILLRDAAITLPGAAGSPDLRVEGLDARVTFEPGVIRLRDASFLVHGIRCDFSGTVRNVPQYGQRSGSSPPAMPTAQLARVGQELDRLVFERGSVRFRGEFDADLGDARSLRIQKASLTAGRVQRGRLALERLQAEATFRDGLLELHQLNAADDTGTLDASGVWNSSGGAAEFHVRSTLALQQVARELLSSPALAELHFYDAPEFQGSVRINPAAEPRLLATGRISARRFGLRSVLFDGFRAMFSYDGSRVLLEDAQLLHRSGSLNARMLSAPGDFRLQVGSTLNPQVLGPLLGPKAMEELGRWKFDQPPRVTLDVRGPAPKMEAVEITGRAALGRGSYRSLPFLSCETDLGIQGNVFNYRNLVVRRSEGVATGNVTYDVPRREVVLRDIRSTLYPVDVISWVVPPLVKDIVPYRFKTRPALRIDGVVNLRTPKGTRLDVGFDAPDGLDYTFLGKELTLAPATAQLRFENNQLRIESIRGTMFDGQLNARATISLDRSAPAHEAEITVNQINFATFTRLYFGYTESKGLMSGTYRFAGRAGDARTMTGNASARLVDGDVFAIPFLGPLSGLLNAIVPGLGYSMARDATATATVRDGVIRTNDFKVDAVGFTMIGGGDLHFLEDRMDFSVRVNAKGLPGVLLFPVSKLFEFTSDGALSKPQWRPKNIPIPR